MVVTDSELNIKKAKKFYESIKKEVDSHSEIVVDISDVQRVDLSAVQIIIAAGREAKNKDKTIKLKGVSETVKRQMHMGGLKI